MTKNHYDYPYYKRFLYRNDIEDISNIFTVTILSINFLSTIIYLFMNIIKKISKRYLNCIFWSSYFSINIPFIFFFTVFSTYDFESYGIKLISDMGSFIFFMILNFIIYKIFNRKKNIEKNDTISSSDNNDYAKIKLNRGKCKDSEITLNDDDITISRKSTDQSNQEIDIIDIHSQDTINDSSNINNNNNNINNSILQKMGNQYSLNNNSFNSMNNNSNSDNNKTISNDFLLQHIYYLHNYIVNNMSNNNEITPHSYSPNNNNYGKSTFNNHNNNNSNDIMNNEKHSNSNNFNTNNNNNVNILPSYSEYVQQPGINYPFIQPTAPSSSVYHKTSNYRNITNMDKRKEKN